MNVLNKVTASLIIISFMFSGEAFSRNHKSEEEKRPIAAKIKPTPSNVTARRKARTAAERKARIKSVRFSAVEKRKATPTARIKTRSAPLTTLEKRKATPTARTKTRSVPLTTLEKRKATAAPPKTKARATPLTTPEKKKATPKARPQVKKPLQSSKKSSVASAKQRDLELKKLIKPLVKRAEKGKKAKPAQIKALIDYVEAENAKKIAINPADVPQEFKSHMKLVALSKNKKIEGINQFTIKEIKEMLTEMQWIENNTPGISRKTFQYFNKYGRLHNKGKAISIDTRLLPQDVRYYVNRFAVERVQKVHTSYMFSSKQSDTFLKTLNRAEKNAKGMTKRMRAFLKSKYGFQG